MKRLLLAGALVLGAGQVVFASTTDALKLTSGGFTATIQDNGACVGNGCVTIVTGGDLNPTAGTDTISGTINGWTISIISGTTHSPNLTPFGLDISSLTAVCNGGLCPGINNVLHVIYSDINFNVPIPAGGFATSYSDTQSGVGSTSESAYFDNGNGLFAETTLIGTVGPFTGTNHGTANRGADCCKSQLLPHPGSDLYGSAREYVLQRGRQYHVQRAGTGRHRSVRDRARPVCSPFAPAESRLSRRILQ